MQRNAKAKLAFFRFKQRGVGIVELGLVLIIVSIGLVGLYQKFSSSSTETQAADLSSDLATLVGKVRSAYAGNYGTVTNAKLDTGGFFKGLSSLTDAAGVVTTNTGGGTLTAAPGTVTAANDSVQYTITQLPDAACLPLATGLAKAAAKLTIGGGVVKAVGTAPNPANITCAGDANTLVLTVQ